MSKTIRESIEEIFYPYVALNSESGTAAENLAAQFAHAYFAGLPYFQSHPDLCGTYPAPGDAFGRGVEWALLKGSGAATVVLIHHFDVVGTEDYGPLRPLAFQRSVQEKS